MKEIEEIFGGANAEEQNVLLHIIKERGYKFFEETPKTIMTVRLLEGLHELGYEISPKAKNNEVLDLVSDSLLKKYMTAIIAEEGVSFISQIETPYIDHTTRFNQEEIDMLKKIESDIENDC